MGSPSNHLIRKNIPKQKAMFEEQLLTLCLKEMNYTVKTNLKLQYLQCAQHSKLRFPIKLSQSHNSFVPLRTPSIHIGEHRHTDTTNIMSYCEANAIGEIERVKKDRC